MERKEINVLVGENIRRERERAGFTQEQLAELVGMGAKNLSAVERGVVGISLTALKRICTVLSVSSDALLFGPPPEERGSALARRLERLSGRQYEIASQILSRLLEAFALEE